MDFPDLTFELPDWVGDFLEKEGAVFRSVEERVRLVITLSSLNIKQQTGGPFGAAIFEQSSGKLIAPGINLVVQSNCSVIHAEILAIMLTQKTLGTHDLGKKGLPHYQLVSSTEPCAMCLGAVYWSGVKSLVIGGRDEDARKVGFDEGVKPSNWIPEFEARGIAVSRDILRMDAASVLESYAKNGGPIYNPSTPTA